MQIYHDSFATSILLSKVKIQSPRSILGDLEYVIGEKFCTGWWKIRFSILFSPVDLELNAPRPPYYDRPSYFGDRRGADNLA